jgi:hypothetical protein
VNDIIAADWGDLSRCLYEGTWNAEIGRFRSNFVYRGVSNQDYDLRTSLVRLGGPYAELERHLLRNFRKYAHSGTTREGSVWTWLALAQHHGLPTRLLDWTYSPYIALHFATEQIADADKNGAIWCVDYVRVHERLPVKLRSVLKEEGSNSFTAEMLNRTVHSLSELEELAESPYVVFFEPPSLDDRIINQFSLFSMMSSASAHIDCWLNDHPELFHRIIIPASMKWEIRDKLDQSNITERVLFPGLDGLTRWLRRQYSPRFEK